MGKLPPPINPTLVLDEIQAAGELFQSGKAARIRVIRLGREAGLTWAQIGERLGMTDAAVIGLAKRAGGDD